MWIRASPAAPASPAEFAQRSSLTSLWPPVETRRGHSLPFSPGMAPVIAALFCLLTAPGQTAPAIVSPAGQAVAAAQQAIEREPQNYQNYNNLALAFIRRAKETTDAAFYDAAQDAVKKSLRLSPGDFETRKLQVSIFLGRREFAQALKLAKELNRLVPDDAAVYGLLCEAYAGLGDYQQAEKAAQWMLDLRPGDAPAYLKAAGLREIFGNPDGAIDLLQAAYQRTPLTETGDRAWILAQIAHIEISRGKLETAEPLLLQALGLSPGYPYALGCLAQVRTGQKRYAEAAELLRQRAQAAPRPQYLYDLAEALDRAGRNQEARETYREFERQARQAVDQPDNANRELIFYYTDHMRRPAEAVAISRLETGRRRDVYALDAQAWALCASGRYAEARKQMETALASGIRDAAFYYHAGFIAARSGDPEGAARYWRQSLELNPASDAAGRAAAGLARLHAQQRRSVHRPNPLFPGVGNP
jgi:tetratricopeptide (TPR) repeat protein